MRTLYINGRVYTGTLPLKDSFAVEDDHFVSCEGSFDRIVDLKGKFVCAGFHDSHMHVLGYGQTLTIAPLHLHTDSLEEMLNCLRTFPGRRGGWLLGRGWNQDYFADGQRMPTRQDLDRVSTEYPICATRACGHALSVNSKALEILGIGEHPAQPEGGQIVLENGIPNGIFLDSAMEMVQSIIPVPSKDEIKNMLRASCAALNARGITAAHSDDYSTFWELPWQTVNEAYRELEEAGELTLRIYEQANFTNVADLKAFLDAGHNTGTGSPLFTVGPLKMLGDGALGARTAYLSRPYADAPDTRGIPVFSQETFDEMIGYAHAHGMQTAVHAIGDACLDRVLSSLEKALASHPHSDHRHGIVHCQITRPDQLRKIADMGLHVYAQSIFLDYDIRIVHPRAGEELAQSSYSWKTLMDLGATLSNGSDCPVELPNVLGGIQCAVTRQNLSGSEPAYLPREAFTVQQALDSFTAGSAYARFREDRMGKIRPGMLADFVILGGDPFSADPARIREIPVLQTVLGGNTVYSHSSF